jgi:predicted dehydrogenase
MERKPEGLDWNACLGGLPRIPWDPKRYFNRFAYWDLSSGGQTGGLFVHMVDVVHWYLNLVKPLAAVAGGGIYQYGDGRDTPEKLNVTFEATLTDMIPEQSADIVFMGTLGRLSIFRSGYTFLPSPSSSTKEKVTGGRAPEGAHLANWLECMKSRSRPNADAVAGHYSSMACHIGNIAYKQQTRVTWQKEWDL